MRLKRNCLSAWNGQANQKFTFINAITVSLFLLQLSFTCNSAFHFIMGEKLWMHILISSRKHPNNNNKICPIPSSACYQQHFHDWFPVLRYNSDLVKLEWTPLLLNFISIRDLSNGRKLFSIAVAFQSG